MFDIPIAGPLLSTGMSEIAKAIADRQSEIDRLQAEIQSLEQILPRPSRRGSAERCRPRRRRRGIGAHDRLLVRTEEEGRQEVGAPPILKPPTAALDDGGGQLRFFAESVRRAHRPAKTLAHLLTTKYRTCRLAAWGLRLFAGQGAQIRQRGRRDTRHGAYCKPHRLRPRAGLPLAADAPTAGGHPVI